MPLREVVKRWCRFLGPPALVWVALVLVSKQYGDIDLLQQRLPAWAFNVAYSIIMIGSVIPLLAILALPVAIYAAVKLRREPWLALSCGLFAAVGALLTLAGLEGPFGAIGERFAWPALAVAAVMATWTGYRAAS